MTQISFAAKTKQVHFRSALIDVAFSYFSPHLINFLMTKKLKPTKISCKNKTKKT